MRVLLVGGGLGCVRAAQELRRLDPSVELTLVSEEPVAPYDRPPLSKRVLQGAEQPTPLVADWDALGVALRLGHRAVALRPHRQVLFDDGTTLPYDALVVGTGATPRRLPGVPGHVIRTASDSHDLRAAMTEAGRLTVVGGGFIGCEAASSARALGLPVTLVELLPEPLARVLGTRVAAEVASVHEAHGVELRRGVSVLESRDGELLLSDGSTVDAACVLVGLGVSPAVEWLEGSSVQVDDGVVCDARGRTSLEGVWAVGDCARWRSPLTGAHRRVEHWTSAAAQGVAAARDVLGQGADLAEVPYVWSDQHGLTLQVVGSPHPDDEVELLRVGPARDRLLAVYGREGALTGALGVSAPKPVLQLKRRLAAGPVPLADALDLVRPAA